MRRRSTRHSLCCKAVWFPTHISDNGQLVATYEPTLPAGANPWLMTIVGNSWHVTSNAEYYATGGWLRLIPEEGRLTFVYPLLQREFDSQSAYRLHENELLLQSGGFAWSGEYDCVSTTRYVKVAMSPTLEMTALT